MLRERVLHARVCRAPKTPHSTPAELGGIFAETVAVVRLIHLSSFCWVKTRYSASYSGRVSSSAAGPCWCMGVTSPRHVVLGRRKLRSSTYMYEHVVCSWRRVRARTVLCACSCLQHAHVCVTFRSCGVSADTAPYSIDIPPYLSAIEHLTSCRCDALMARHDVVVGSIAYAHSMSKDELYQFVGVPTLGEAQRYCANYRQMASYGTLSCCSQVGSYPPEQ